MLACFNKWQHIKGKKNSGQFSNQTLRAKKFAPLLEVVKIDKYHGTQKYIQKYLKPISQLFGRI